MGNIIVNVLKKWWIALVVGLISLLLGFVLLFNPGTGFEIARIIVIVDYLIIALAAIAVTIARRDEIPAWGWNLAGAIFLFVLGIVVALTPGVSDGIIIAMFIIGFFIEGVSGIYGSIVLRELYAPGWVWSMIFSVMTIILGFLLLFNPLVAAVSIDFLVAAAMLSFGVSMIFISYRLSKIKGSLNIVRKQIEAGDEIIIEVEEEEVETDEELNTDQQE